MAPGVEVAQINSNKWAVSIRGFNGLYANKLLVLIDGRSVYNRLFSGVLWDAQDLMLEDIDRIEVIRGPGAAMWGANAVNGVINIVTKTRPTRRAGSSASAAATPIDREPSATAGPLGAARYRLYAQWTSRAESLIAPGRAPTMRPRASRRAFAPTGPRGLARSWWTAASRQAGCARSGPTSTR